MAIRQQYYTSCQKPEKSGFQVKAESPGISNDTRQLLRQLIGYEIPYQADPSAIDTHPVAFRYFVKDNQAFLISSQSCGKDEFVRDGNFFAHSAIGTPQEISHLAAPIFYWKSPFWVSGDPSDTSELPLVEEFDAEVTFDFDSVWSFLDKGNRREWFYKLLCAVVDYHQSKRKIIILDDNEAIAFWIACVSMAFPSRYLQFLSFATYHHDPYTAPFIITGTTADSNFRFTNDEYYSYFVLNALHNRISEVPESDYAQHLTRYLNSEQYDGEVLDFFYWLERYDRESIITKSLDDYANFRLTTTYHSLSPHSPKAIQAAQLVISELCGKTSSGDEELVDLRTACQLLGEAALQSQTSRDLLESYSQALEGLKERDNAFFQTIPSALNIFVSLVLKKQEQDAEFLWSKLETIYLSSVLIETLNSKDFVQAIAHRLSDNDPDQTRIFWKLIGEKIVLSSSTESALAIFLEKSFTTIPGQERSRRFNVPDLLIQVMNSVTRIPGIESKFILTCAASYKQQRPHSPLLEWVYYYLVRRVSFVQRVHNFWSYWRTFEKLVPDLYSYELQSDLLTSQSVSQSVDVIEHWVSNIDESTCPRILREALEYLGKKPIQNREQLSLQILNHRKISTFWRAIFTTS